jgi:hypothetical protein
MDPPRVESYRFGQIVVAGQHHHRDVIILPDRVLGEWWRQRGHVLHPEDLAAVFQAGPGILVVGLGAHSRMQIAAETRRALQTAGIRLLALPTDQACEAYNALQEGQPGKVAAALHLTC